MCAENWWLENDDVCYFLEVGGGVVVGKKRYPQSFGDNKLGSMAFVEDRYDDKCRSSSRVTAVAMLRGGVQIGK